MKKLLYLLTLLWAASSANAQSTCSYEYVTNGEIGGFSGGAGVYNSSTLNGWSQYSGTPSVSGDEHTGTPSGTGSIFLREVNSAGSSEGTFNTLTQPLIPNKRYRFGAYVKATQFKSAGALEVVLASTFSPLVETTGQYIANPYAFASNYINNNFDGMHVGTIDINNFGIHGQWKYVQFDFTAPNNGLSYNQLLILPREDLPGNAGPFEVRVDDVSLRNINDMHIQVELESHQVCDGVCDGVLRFSAYGGTEPYTYSYVGLNPANSGSGILGADNSALVSDLCPDTYSITMTDARGCSQTWMNRTINATACPNQNWPFLNDTYSGGATFNGKYYGDKDVHLWHGTYMLQSGTIWEMQSCGIKYDTEGNPLPNSYRKIYVHEGAELVVDQATITGFCNNVWYGIILDDPKAKVKVIDGGVIEHAYRGISGTGERIELAYAEFINNVNGISNCQVESNYIENSSFNSSNWWMPYPYNNGVTIMEKAIELYSNDISVIESNVIDNVVSGMEVFVYGTSSLKDNNILNIRKYGLQLYNESGTLITAENNTLELNATSWYAPASGFSTVYGIYQFHIGWPSSDKLNVRFYKNKIFRTTGSTGFDLIGINDVSRGSGNNAFYENNTILLGNTSSETSVSFRSDRNQAYGNLVVKKNHISQSDIGLQIGNESSYSSTTYSINCNVLSTLDWGIETIVAQANGNTDVTRLRIGQRKSPAGNYWVNIPSNQYLKNNSLYKLIYWKTTDELIDDPNCYNFSLTRYAVNRGIFSTQAICQ